SRAARSHASSRPWGRSDGAPTRDSPSAHHGEVDPPQGNLEHDLLRGGARREQNRRGACRDGALRRQGGGGSGRQWQREVEADGTLPGPPERLEKGLREAGARREVDRVFRGRVGKG